MTTRMLIDATHSEETRVVVIKGNRLEEFDYESATKKQLKGNIYLAKVTRVEPALQAAFVDYGGNRHGFLAFSEIHPDYYQIPVEDRQALIDEEAAEDDEEDVAERLPAAAEPQPSIAEEAPPESVANEQHHEETAAADGEPAPSIEPEAGEAEAKANEAGLEEEPEDAPIDGIEVAPPTDTTVETVGADDELEEVTNRRARRARRYKIQEVIRRRQILLVQVVKEERGNKGAALTTYLSLAGRFCVLMPNSARGGGISRKIANASDRKRLKSIVDGLELPDGMGVIVRTAGMEQNKREIKRDCDYLIRLWDTIREQTLKSTAPALIYEEGNLIKRSIRDLYSKDIDEVLVEGDEGYRTAKEFMRMLMPSHAKAVQPYKEKNPLFSRYQVDGQLDSMFSPTVHLKSGGYIVINATEALVAIDVNSGRATREHNIEETALKTNLEAAEEAARQLRLRDLAGLIVIDFIDMEKHQNNRAVERRLKERLKHDRARIQVGRISAFGLLEMSRQRLRPGLLEATTSICSHCAGTGVVRSTESSALQVIRAIEEEGIRGRSDALVVHAPPAVMSYILNQKRNAINDITGRYGMAIQVLADEELIAPNFSLDRAARHVGEAREEPTEAATPDDKTKAPPPVEAREESGEDGRKGRRRRRGRRRRGREVEDGVEARPKPVVADQVLEANASEREAEPLTKDKTAASGSEEQGRTKGRRRRGRRGGRSRRRDGEKAPVETSSGEQPSPSDTMPADLNADTAAGQPQQEPEESSATSYFNGEEPDAPIEAPKTGRPLPAEEMGGAALAASPAEMEPVVNGGGEEQAASSEPAQPRRVGWWQRRTQK